MRSSNSAETEAGQESEPMPAENHEAPPHSGAEAGTSEAESADSQRHAEHQIPDPSALVAMAAMHMPTVDLMHVMVTVFDAHAWRAMGLVADHSGEVRKDMPSAQMAIDCLSFLVGKIESSLEETERRDIQRRLTDLRMNYVAKMRES